MRILISNDDGYQAPGIRQLAKTLGEFAEVFIVAPDRNRSGASNSLTLDQPLTVHEYDSRCFYVNGTPTDCVHLAVTNLMDAPPDIIVSGINDTGNLGHDVLYSGTVAAAVSGTTMGFPAIAVSLEGGVHYESAARVAATLVKRLGTHKLPTGTILNVNVPDLPHDKIEGYEITRLGTREISKPATREVNPRGKEIYWMGLPGDAVEAGPGTDFCAINEGKVSLTPLKFDLTHYEVFENLSTWFDGLF